MSFRSIWQSLISLKGGPSAEEQQAQIKREHEEQIKEMFHDAQTILWSEPGKKEKTDLQKQQDAKDAMVLVDETKGEILRIKEGVKGDSLVHIAVRSNNAFFILMLKEWIKKSDRTGELKLDAIWNEKNRDGQAPLHVAASANRPKAGNALLDAGAGVRGITDDIGRTPAEVVRQTKERDEAFRQRLESVLLKGPETRQASDLGVPEKKFPPSEKKQERVEYFINKIKAHEDFEGTLRLDLDLIKEMKGDYQALLQAAIDANNLNAVRLLLRQDADPNKTSYFAAKPEVYNIVVLYRHLGDPHSETKPEWPSVVAAMYRMYLSNPQSSSMLSDVYRLKDTAQLAELNEWIHKEYPKLPHIAPPSQKDFTKFKEWVAENLFPGMTYEGMMTPPKKEADRRMRPDSD